MLSSFDREYIHRVCSIIKERAGISVLEHQQDILKQSLAEALKLFHYQSSGRLLESLSGNSTVGNKLFKFLIDSITVGESYFFRDDNQVDYLRNHFIPNLVSKKIESGNKHIRIWSAGCSSGQEIFTVAMMLDSYIQDIDSWRIDLLGTDINRTALASAKKAEFNQWSFRKANALYKINYFSKVEGRDVETYSIDNKIKKMVRFEHLNLQEDSYPSVINQTNNIDLILCRNVFIYISNQFIPDILDRMTRCLLKDAVLLLAPSDYPYSKLSQKFECRTEKECTYAVNSLASTLNRTADFNSADASADDSNMADDTSISDLDLDIESFSTTDSGAVCTDVTEKALHLLANENWQEVVDLIGSDYFPISSLKDLQLNKFRMQTLVKLNRFNEAEGVFKECIKENSSDKEVYLLGALIYISLHDTGLAEQLLTKAVYIDSGFIEAHYYSALLSIQNNNLSRGLGCFNTAINLCDKMPATEQTVLHPRVSYMSFKLTIKKEMHAYDNSLGRVG